MSADDLKKAFDQAVKAETILTEREKEALLVMYHNLLIDIHLQAGTVEMDIQHLAGAIEYLQMSGKVLETEELWMLMNMVEAEVYA